MQDMLKATYALSPTWNFKVTCVMAALAKLAKDVDLDFKLTVRLAPFGNLVGRCSRGLPMYTFCTYIRVCYVLIGCSRSVYVRVECLVRRSIARFTGPS